MLPTASPPDRGERIGTVIALGLLLATVAIGVLTFVTVVLRGPPWSTSGFHTPPAARGS